MLLFFAGKLKKELLGLILNYFATIKINDYSIFYFHYLI